MIYNQVKNDSRSFSYNRIADLSKLPEYYLQQMSQPALKVQKCKENIKTFIRKSY